MGAVHRAGLVQGDDRRVRESRARQRLTAGALAVAVGAEPDPLDGHFAVQQLVVGPPDDPKATGAESLGESVAPEDQVLGAGLLHTRPARAARDPPAGVPV